MSRGYFFVCVIPLYFVILNSMRREKKHLTFFYLFFFLFIATLVYILFVDPTNYFIISGIYFSPSIIFFLLLFGSIFSLFSFLLLNKRRGSLVGIFITGCLLLRFFGFRGWFYLVLFASIILLIELFLSDKTKNNIPKLSKNTQP